MTRLQAINIEDDKESTKIYTNIEDLNTSKNSKPKSLVMLEAILEDILEPELETESLLEPVLQPRIPPRKINPEFNESNIVEGPRHCTKMLKA